MTHGFKYFGQPLSRQCTIDFLDTRQIPPLRLVSTSKLPSCDFPPRPSSFSTDPLPLRPICIYLAKDHLSSPLSCLTICRSILSYVACIPFPRDGGDADNLSAEWQPGAPAAACRTGWVLSYLLYQKYMTRNKTQYEAPSIPACCQS
jgi:hypothetical protein